MFSKATGNSPKKLRPSSMTNGLSLATWLRCLRTATYRSLGEGKDLIISGGLNIYPKEIEDVLNDQKGVVESAVVGVPHYDFGEGIVAVLVGEGTLDMGALEIVCREKLAGFKVPRRWIQLEALPRNTMGKVQKNLLRDEYANSFV